MKSILFIFCLIFAKATFAGNTVDKITIGSNAKTSKLEIRYTSKYKKPRKATVKVLDATGKTVSQFKCEILHGSNAISMQNALQFAPGIYTLEMSLNKKKTETKVVLLN